jgi:hypothetical protein
VLEPEPDERDEDEEELLEVLPTREVADRMADDILEDAFPAVETGPLPEPPPDDSDEAVLLLPEPTPLGRSEFEDTC